MTEHCAPTSDGTITSTPTQKYFGKTLIPKTIGVVDNFFLTSRIEGELSLSSEERERCLGRFGLLDRSPDAWSKFANTISKLNKNAGPDKRYVVLFSSRHGEAYHNAAMTKYIDKWATVMNEKDGDEEYTWAPDPCLTNAGEDEAKKLGRRVREQAQQGMPMPESLYSSIHERSLRTTKRAFGEDTTIKVSERLREQMGMLRCHERHPTSKIREKHPHAVFETDTPEEDLLHSDTREEQDHLDRRVKSVLADICASDESTFISITSHQGVFDSILRTVGHPPLGDIKPAGMAMFVVQVTGTPVDSVENGNTVRLPWRHPDECQVSFTTGPAVRLPQSLFDDNTAV